MSKKHPSKERKNTAISISYAVYSNPRSLYEKFDGPYKETMTAEVQKSIRL